MGGDTLPQTDYSTLAQAVRQYTDMGLHVLLLPPRSKGTFKGSHGLHDSTNSFSQLEPLVEEHPGANIAIDPVRSGLLVADFDRRNNGDALLGVLLAAHGVDAFDTPQVAKVSGPHHYYLAPPSASSSELRKLSLPSQSGIDLLGDAVFAQRKYIVAPYSTHPDGYSYEWATGRALWECPIPPFPLEFLDTLNQYFRPGGKGRQDLIKAALTAGSIAETEHLAEAKAKRSQESDLRQYDSDERVAKAVCECLGVPFKPGKHFCSPLRSDQSPSASIYLGPDGIYKYHDFARGHGRYYSLCQLFGAFITGRSEPLPELKPTEFAVWQTRMLVELDFVDVPVVVSLPPIPLFAPQHARAVYNGLHVLLQCRAVFYNGIEPTPLTTGFTMLWCGISEFAAKAGIGWLRDEGLIVKRHEKKGPFGKRLSLYLPSNYAAPGNTAHIEAHIEAHIHR